MISNSLVSSEKNLIIYDTLEMNDSKNDKTTARDLLVVTDPIICWASVFIAKYLTKT